MRKSYEDAGCSLLGVGCLAMLVLAFAWNALLAWLLTLAVGALGGHLHFWPAFIIVFLVMAFAGAVRGSSGSK